MQSALNRFVGGPLLSCLLLLLSTPGEMVGGNRSAEIEGSPVSTAPFCEQQQKTVKKKKKTKYRQKGFSRSAEGLF